MRDVERYERTEPGRMMEEAGTEYFEYLERVPAQVWYMGAMASLMASAFMFFTDRRNWGFFFGQLVPTMLVLPLFYRILHPSRESMRYGMHEMAERARETMHRMGEAGYEGMPRAGETGRETEYGPERYTER